MSFIDDLKSCRRDVLSKLEISMSNSEACKNYAKAIKDLTIILEKEADNKKKVGIGGY